MGELMRGTTMIPQQVIEIFLSKFTEKLCIISAWYSIAVLGILERHTLLSPRVRF